MHSDPLVNLTEVTGAGIRVLGISINCLVSLLTPEQRAKFERDVRNEVSRDAWFNDHPSPMADAGATAMLNSMFPPRSTG